MVGLRFACPTLLLSATSEIAMNMLLVCVAAATLGFDVGWERLPDGGMEYIIQLDAARLDALRSGQPIGSDIPAAAGEIRAFRIVMGPGKPKREIPLPKPAPALPAAVKPVQAEPASPPAKPAPVETPPPPQSSIPLTMTILGLFASLGANVFLAWIAWGFRRRCQNTA
jgi:hypothetical protein